MFLSFAAAFCFNAVGEVPEVADYKLNVQNFCELTVVDGVPVEYYCNPDSAGWAVFSCPPELASQIMFSNNAERLTVRTSADEKPIPGIPVIKVYSASLRKVENSGDSLLRVMGIVPVKEFKARQIGNGCIELNNIDCTSFEGNITAGHGSLKIEGKSEKAKLSNVSTGPIDAKGLHTSNVNCFVLGTGDIECSPSGQLKIYGAGSGKVLYYTTPEKISQRSIGVKAIDCTQPTEESK